MAISKDDLTSVIETLKSAEDSSNSIIKSLETSVVGKLDTFLSKDPVLAAIISTSKLLIGANKVIPCRQC